MRFKNPPPVERHTWIEAPFNEGRAVWQHLMADGVWRIDYQMAPNADPALVSREDVVQERLHAQFSQLGRTLTPDDYEIVWVGPYAYRSECVDTLRHGRVFFAGDSAHVVSPFGARGGNSGVQDADNLAWKLAAVVSGKAAASLLDSYHAEQHEAAQHNVMVTNRTARFLRPADGAERLFRTAAIGLAKRHAFARQLVNTGRMSAPNIYTRSAACVASSAGSGLATQNTPFVWADSSPGTLGELLGWAQGRLLLLLVFGEFPLSTAAWLQALTTTTPGLRCVQVLGKGERADAMEHIRDADGHVRATCHATSAGWALVRPDSYLAATGQHIDATLAQAIAAALGGHA